MNSPLLLLMLLALATGIGFRIRATQGRVKVRPGLQLTKSEIGTTFGKRFG